MEFICFKSVSGESARESLGDVLLYIQEQEGDFLILVTDSEGIPVEGQYLCLTRAGVGEASSFSRTDENGLVRLTDLVPNEEYLINLARDHSEGQMIGPWTPSQSSLWTRPDVPVWRKGQWEHLPRGTSLSEQSDNKADTAVEEQQD